MRQRILGSHTPPCHRGMVITTQFNVLPLTRGGGCSGHGKLAKSTHQKALEKSLGINDQSCPVLRLSHHAMW